MYKIPIGHNEDKQFIFGEVGITTTTITPVPHVRAVTGGKLT
jgi:hypothetical protein